VTDCEGLLYEQGTRILNFQRYPPLFGKEALKMLPPDFVTSNVDLAASIFQVAGVSPPSEYQMDGVSYVDDVVGALGDPDFDQVTDGEASCEFKFLDAQNSHSMVNGKFQYIFRATDAVDTMYDVDTLYPNTYDMEQLYDLEADPNQKHNIFNDGAAMMAHKETIAKFETLMRNYLDAHCIAVNQHIQCIKPDLRFGSTGGGVYDVPTTTAHGDGGGGDGEFECSSNDDCRGSQICGADGICGRSSSGGSDSDGGCSSDGDCRGSQICTDGECGRPTSGGSGGGGGGRGGGSGGRGGGGGPGRAEEVEEMAFNGAVTVESERSFLLQTVTVNVSTVLAMIVMAMMVLIAKNCFWEMYGQKVAVKRVEATYGSV